MVRSIQAVRPVPTPTSRIACDRTSSAILLTRILSPTSIHPERARISSTVSRRRYSRRLLSTRDEAVGEALVFIARKLRRSALDGEPSGEVQPAPEAVNFRESGVLQHVLVPPCRHRYEDSF